MAVLKNRAKMSTSTTGTGTITLGSAEDGYQSFADAGVVNADVVRYIIEDTGGAFEIGTGTYTSSGTTLSRTVSESSNSDATINLSGSATVFIGATAEDIPALYAENPSTPTANTVTGSNSVALGSNLTVSGDNSLAAGTGGTATGYSSFAFGDGADATGNHSVAIGGGAIQASGAQSIAIGYGSDATSTDSHAFGRNANAGGSSSTALGRDAVASTTRAMALGDSYANGVDSLAAAIANNSSSYGATGANSIAMGKNAKATGVESTAIGRENIASGERSFAAGGYNATASGADTVAIGYQAQATATYAAAIGFSNEADGVGSLALGYNSTASSQNSVVIGNGVQSTAANQVSIGGTTDTVRISETYTLPTADGTNGQVLTTNGSGAVTFADAGGGGDPDLYRDNAVSATTPIASGDNAVAIGTGSDATSTYSLAIGRDALCNKQDALAIGSFATATGNRSTAVGQETDANSTDATAIGRRAQAVSGTGATALTNSYCSAYYGFAAAIGNNTSSYGATGSNSFAIGRQSKSTGQYSAALGYRCVASGEGSVAIGNQAEATGDNSRAMGYQAIASGSNSLCLSQESTASGSSSAIIGGYGNVADATYSFASGQYADTNGIFGKMSRATGRFPATGDAQSGTFVLRSDTTDATAEPMTTANTPTSSLNITQIVVPSNAAFAFHGTIVAKQSGSANAAAWKVEGLIVNNGGTTTLTNSATTVISNTPSWGMALSADDTNDALAITVTGAASTNIRWVATINTSEVTYA